MSTPRELIYQGKKLLDTCSVPDSLYDAGVLLGDVLGKNPLELRLDTFTQVNDECQDKFFRNVSLRCSRQPLQYILSSQPFMSHDFYVDRRVLIPRPETELLCELAVTYAGKRQLDVLDLCCGSGCIGISVKLDCPDTSVTLADLSEDALAVAEANAKRLNAQVRLCRGNLFEAVGNQKFHMILSNPPYIPSSECSSLQEEVQHEPVMALDGGSDGMDFYRRICAEAPAHLFPEGRLICEAGYGEAEEIAFLMRQSGFSSVIYHNDYQQIPRIVDAKI